MHPIRLCLFSTNVRRVGRPHPLRRLARLTPWAALVVAIVAALVAPSAAGAAPFTATADTYVDNGAPQTNYGTSTSLRFDSRPTVQRTFIRFSVQGISDAVASARLRFVCTNGGPGGAVSTTNGSWTETGITWDNQPALGGQVSSSGALTCDSTNGTVVEYDVTSAVTGNGTYNFVLTTGSGDGIRFRSRELTSSAPQLLVQAGSGTGSADQIHLSWTADPRTTMTVMWHTPALASPATVQYGPTVAYGSTVTGQTFPSTGEGHLHQTSLSGLTPGSLYHYRVLGEDGSWSPDHSFQTAPAGDSSFRFLAAGDMGTPKAGKHLNSVAISNAMAARSQGLAFTVGAGDYWYAIGSSDEATVDQWFNQNQGHMSAAPFMPAFGNHEKDTSKRYYTRLALPPPENYFSYNYGGAHFLIIDTNVGFAPGSAQRAFIETDLQNAAADASVDWIFVALHHPPFASSSTYQNQIVRNELSPLFDSFGVDVVLTGHAHFYERTYPVRANGSRASTNQSDYTNPGAPIYMVTGGGGADPQSQCSSSRAAWSVTCRSVYEFLEITVSPTTIQLSAIDPNGATIDGFTLRNTNKAPTPTTPTGDELVFLSAADATVRADNPDRNYGGSSSLQTDNSPVKNFLLKFNVSGTMGGVIASARLQLYCSDPSSSGGDFRRVTDNTWAEGLVTWNNAPPGDTVVLASLGTVQTGSWYEVDITPLLLAGDGTYSLRVTSASTNGADYSSKEGGSTLAPRLVVTLE